MSAADIIRQFRSVVEQPFETARKWKKDGNQPVVGYSCTYFPEEIVLAAGALPFRLFGESAGILRADAHIQAYGCSLARLILEDALSGELGFLDTMVFPHSCDTMQRLSDIWRLNIRKIIHLDLLFPAQLNSDTAKDYLESVLERFRIDLGNALQREISDQALSEAILLMNRIRSALRSLAELRSGRPELISGSDFSHVVRGCMIMDRDEAAKRLEDLNRSLADVPAERLRSPRKRLMLSGGVCLHPDIYGMIEAQGGAVILDDLCTGNRYFDTPVSTELSPVTAIANRFINRAICPAKHSGITRRADALVKAALEHRVDGIIFLFLKFCDPHGFDYPDLKTALESAGIPGLLLEVETGKPVDGPTQTRVETFLQILNQSEPAL